MDTAVMEVPMVPDILDMGTEAGMDTEVIMDTEVAMEAITILTQLPTRQKPA